ncbi:formylglycine-generating enzyme family protein [Burkholderia sp. 9120]|uniref:formylglycine-generating enzyme family protein n=1 Tax=Burkholderia sp. 9120 TaxID=1500897 RepID=UPI0009DE4365|nr:formylglycine-generating enzyme family protein [Burkholderia sp. 9120]
MLQIFLIILIFTSNAMASDKGVAKNNFENFRDCDVCSEMIVLPSGKYMMGATEEEFRGHDRYAFMYAVESPRHEAYVKSFAIARFDVTRKQFAAFAEATGFTGKGCYIFDGKEWLFDTHADWKNPGFRQTDLDPVVCVSWSDAQKFISWVNARLQTSKAAIYRLPSETEWEYATRAGTTTPTYWGVNPVDVCVYENTRDQSARALDATAPIADCTDGYVETAPVGSFRPNPWGLFDTLGNVSKWMADCYQISYWNFSSVPLPKSEACALRSIRGASWATIPITTRAAGRNGLPPDKRDSSVGFRLAADLKR